MDEQTIEKTLAKLKSGKSYGGQWRSVTTALYWSKEKLCFVFEQQEPCNSYGVGDWSREYSAEELTEEMRAMSWPEFMSWVETGCT